MIVLPEVKQHWARAILGWELEVLLAWVWILILLRGEWTVNHPTPHPGGCISPSGHLITKQYSQLPLNLRNLGLEHRIQMTQTTTTWVPNISSHRHLLSIIGIGGKVLLHCMSSKMARNVQMFK